MSESAAATAATPRPKRAYNRRTGTDAKSVGVKPNVPPQFEQTAAANPIRDHTSDEQVGRKSRGERMVGALDVPAHRKRRGWSYQFVTITIHGQPADPSTLIDTYEGGWRPVPAKEIPELCVPGVTTEFIELRGQRLYWRPEYLTQEAKREDKEAADQQVRDRVQGALEGRPHGVEGLANVRGVIPRTLETTVEGGNWDMRENRSRG